MDFAPPEGDPGRLRAAAGNFRSISSHLAQQTNTMRAQAQTAVDTAGWKGGYALRFRVGADGVVAQADDMGTSLGSLAEMISKLAADLQTAIEEVARCQQMAEHALAEARHSVSRLDPAAPTYNTAKGAAEFQASVTYTHYLGLADKAKAHYQRLAQSAAGRIDALTDRAVPGGSGMTSAQIVAAVDDGTGIAALDGDTSLSADQAWAALEQWTDPDTNSNFLNSLRLSLVAAMPPADAARWWSTLTPVQQMQAIRIDPSLGNVDGVAFWARDLANRSQINVYQDQLEQRRAELLHELDELKNQALPPDSHVQGIYAGHQGRLAALTRQLDLVEDKIASLRQVESLATRRDHHVIGLDMTHQRAQAIIAQGDLDAARNIGVFTPGLTSTVQGMQDNDDDMGLLRSRTARAIRDAMSPAQIEAAGGYGRALAVAKSQVATVTWLDYQAPQITTESLEGSNSVASSHTAKEGGAALADFYRGLDQSRGHGGHGNPHVVAMAHSYGTTVQGYAAQHHHTGIDTAYFSESPGMGADSADDFDVSHGQVFYSEGDNDQVADARQFGVDPSQMPGVKHLETRASTDPITGHPLAGVTKHPFHEYVADNTTSGYNQVKLLADQQQDLIYGNDTDGLDDLRLRDHLDNPLVLGVPTVGPGLYALNKGFEALGR